MIDAGHSLLLIGAMAACTMLLRFLPFIMFSKGTPKVILYLGDVLPNAIIAMLVIYCLRNMDLMAAGHGVPEIASVLMVAGHGVPEIASVLMVVVIHKWRHNMILSILAGTVIYMILIRVM